MSEGGNMNAMDRKGKVEVLVIGLALLLVFVTVMVTFEPGKQDTWNDVSELHRSPAWYEANCDYVEIDPEDNTPLFPDGIYVNCDESSTESPDTWEHWFPTVPKPEK